MLSCLMQNQLSRALSPENWFGENVSGGPKISVSRANFFGGKMVLGLTFHGNMVPHRKKWSVLARTVFLYGQSGSMVLYLNTFGILINMLQFRDTKSAMQFA